LRFNNYQSTLEILEEEEKTKLITMNQVRDENEKIHVDDRDREWQHAKIIQIIGGLECGKSKVEWVEIGPEGDKAEALDDITLGTPDLSHRCELSDAPEPAERRVRTD
jgi:hypothetical protein